MVTGELVIGGVPILLVLDTGRQASRNEHVRSNQGARAWMGDEAREVESRSSLSIFAHSDILHPLAALPVAPACLSLVLSRMPNLERSVDDVVEVEVEAAAGLAPA